MEEYFGENKIDPTGYHGFPEYEQKMFDAPYTVEIQLLTEEDCKKFSKLIELDEPITKGIRSAKSMWYPSLGNGERGSCKTYIWVNA